MMKPLLLLGLLVLCSASQADKRDNQEYYTVKITTSDDYGAGTDAHVKIKLIGNKATTPAITLDNPNHDDFEAGSADKFEFWAIDVGGHINAVELWRDTNGLMSGWKVEVVEVSWGNWVAYFWYYKWIDEYRWIRQDISRG